MSAEDFEGIKELAKKHHTERVAKTPQRIEYAIQRFSNENIPYILKNEQTGHFHLFDSKGNLFQFWASTGKIWFDKKTKNARGFKYDAEHSRGIESCIKIIKQWKGVGYGN